MSFHRLSLKNFKCFQETDIQFGKITLLTGPNSSGKSSLINAILAVLQTEEFPLYLAPNGKYVNMGDFEEIVFGHDRRKEIEITIEGDGFPALLPSEDVGDGNFVIHSRWINDEDTGLPRLNKLVTESNESIIHIEKKDKQLQLNVKFKPGKQSTPTIIPNGSLMDRLISGINVENYPIKIPFSKEEMIKGELYHNLFGWWVDMISYGSFYGLNYISPFRLPPERTYYQKPKAKRKIELNGEGYIDQIVDWENASKDKFFELVEIVKNLKLFQEIKIQNLKGGRFEVKVKVKAKSPWASIVDVGFGISQFLPIIVADLQLEWDSTLILAQPEIHLHPNVQSLLGGYFVEQVTKNGKNYIIETHSEYLLNRIRLAIVKKQIKPEEVTIYYFENHGNGAKTYRLEFTKDGQIKNAPEGFFETYMIDTMNIALFA